jgi:hypothetical protein
MDYDGERGKVTFRGEELTAGNYDAQIALQDALVAAIQNITLGTLIQRDSIVVSESTRQRPDFETAQRQTAWRVIYEDTSTHKTGRVTIPTADLNHLPAGGSEVSLSDETVAAFVDAFEAYALSNQGNALEVLRIEHVGRDYGRSQRATEQVPEAGRRISQHATWSGDGTLVGYEIEPVNKPSTQFYGAGISQWVRVNGDLYGVTNPILLDTTLPQQEYVLEWQRGAEELRWQFRFLDNGNYWRLYIQEHRLALYLRLDGELQVLMAQTSTTIPESGFYQYQLQNLEERIRVYSEHGNVFYDSGVLAGETITEFRDAGSTGIGHDLWVYEP